MENKLYNKKIFTLVGIIISILVLIILLYPIGHKLIKDIRTHSYVYKYTSSRDLKVEDISNLPSAQSVPILMYHGVIVNSLLGDNTERSVFISHMEMLKEKGYQTISIKEYDLWREDKFTLPSKPIIITFDDGRKDSYFTVDDVFKKLGFKGTIFVATDSTINNPFFLGWSDYKKMQSTGRWEIEAHGQKSHLGILIDEKGDMGNYLSSRIYSAKNGLESVENYEKRISQEYISGKSDLLNNLGIDSKYFAIPLNSYGTGSSYISNYDGGYVYNDKLTRLNYKLSFIQAKSVNNKALESFYNYKDSDPYKLKRLAVENMTANDLFLALDAYAFKSPSLTFPKVIDENFISNNINLLYGKVGTDNGLTLESSAETPSARFVVGNKKWKNYKVEADIIKEKGRSASVVVYYTDESNYISLDWEETDVNLIEHINGNEDNIISLRRDGAKKEMFVLMQILDGKISVYFDDSMLVQNFPVKLIDGNAGFGVWDPAGAKSTIKKLNIIELK